MDDHFLPYRATETICEIMHLIENHIPQCLKRHGMLIQHVAEHFGGHDHDIGLGIDRRVAREQSDLVRTILIHEIMVFLVAQRLDRRRVESLDVMLLRQINGEIRHHRLAGAGRSRDKHVVSRLQRIIRPQLEIIKFERHGLREPRGNRLAFGLGFTECGVPLRG